VELPLFPLKSVLFPGAQMPLVIFEERYRQMTRELLASGGTFGIVLIRSGNEVGPGAIPFEVGTVARIEECEEVEDGRFRMQARGIQRFRLVTMLPPRPYPYGEVELIDDSAVEQDQRLARAVETVRAVFPVYFRMALMLTDQWSRGITLPSSPHRLVDFLAPWLQTEEEVKQRLLEIIPAADRVAYLAEVLDDLVTRTGRDVTEYKRRKYAGLGAGN
jgi:Lon protease-like protein